MTERYLSDGVYYESRGYDVALTAGGPGANNRIYLDALCLKALFAALCLDYGKPKILALLPESATRQHADARAALRSALCEISACASDIGVAQGIARRALDADESTL